ncbi:tripartite tricarboxylate transporter substrate binding protein [Advenella sp. FME57]|uniref:Bug family tripartite tricarboxylate transporter substrate binding protein n=1 Tax=Advenella sp. FME57 TaxID=2742604 RepID=UPI001D01874F|nr:tripartite tricarboxylate transporter substrate-binding protein [Advenella sp. FME57]
MLSSDSTNVLNSLLYPNLSYDPSLHLKPLSLLSDLPILLVVDPKLPITNLKEFVAYAKANPRKLNFGSPGNGGIFHLAGELFSDQAGIELQHIAYRGGGEVMNAVMRGEVQAYFGVVGSTLPFVNSGKLRALAVGGGSRMPALPEVPTFSESGYPEFQVASRYGLTIPAATPQPIVDRLSKAIQAVLSNAEFRKRFESLGFVVPVTSSPSQFKAIIEDDKIRWQSLIRRQKLTLE